MVDMGFVSMEEMNNQFLKYRRPWDFPGWRKPSEEEAAKITRCAKEREQKQKRINRKSCFFIALLGLTCFAAGLYRRHLFSLCIAPAVLLLLVSFLAALLRIQEQRKYRCVWDNRYLVLPCEVWKIDRDRDIRTMSRIYVKSGEWLIHPDSFLLDDSEISDHIVRSETRCLIVWYEDSLRLDLYMV